jgi:hypothetical protein
MSDTTTPRLPAVGEYVRGVGTLHAVEQPPAPPPPPPVYIFQQTTATAELRRNGELLKELQTLTDWYGLETSVATCIDEMRSYCARQRITSTSELEVVVVRVVSYYRARPVHQQENILAREFQSFSVLDHGGCWDVPEPEETVVWSSRNLDDPRAIGTPKETGS